MCSCTCNSTYVEVRGKFSEMSSCLLYYSMLVDSCVSSQFSYHRVPSCSKKCWNYRCAPQHLAFCMDSEDWLQVIRLPTNLLGSLLYIFELCYSFCSSAIWFLYKSWILITCKIYSCKHFSIFYIIFSFFKCNCHNDCAHLWGTVQGFNRCIHCITVKSGFLSIPSTIALWQEHSKFFSKQAWEAEARELAWV